MKTIQKIKTSALIMLVSIPLLFISIKAIAGTTMQVRIDSEECNGCGICVSILPEYIEFNSDGKAQFKTPTVPLSDELLECVSQCPQNAISIVGAN